MSKFLTAGVFAVISILTARADVTLEQCVEAAVENYPLIKRYELLEATENLELSDINKGWLPRLGVYAQGSVQNVVPSFPKALTNMMEQMGGEVRGLGKLQYKLGLDVNQTIWDGGASRAQRETTRKRADLDRARLDVDLYAVRQRVEGLYFGILLLDSQIAQTESAIGVYRSNLDRMKAMLDNGTAMQADVDMVEAQLLALEQQLASARSATKGYRQALTIFTAIDLDGQQLLLPSADIPAELSTNRPELKAMSSQSALNDTRTAALDAALMPKIGFFAQGYYGYPGIDYFKAMMKRDLTFNILAGVKVSWNIDALYTRKNSLKQIAIDNQQIDTERETFLLNSSIQSARDLEEIRGIEAVMVSDERIVELRRNVRLAAESQLRNGIIDATALTMKINDETQARLAAAFHKIQRMQAIYNLKNTLNR